MVRGENKQTGRSRNKKGKVKRERAKDPDKKVALEQKMQEKKQMDQRPTRAESPRAKSKPNL